MDLKGTFFFHMHQIREALCQCLSSILANCLAWAKGVKVEGMVKAKGVPYFYRTPHSVITLGKDCSIVSSFRSNNIGTMCRSRICSQTPQAIIEIGQRVGMSSVTLTAHEQISIGDDTMIGAGTIITDSDWHSLSTDVAERHRQLGKSAPIRIGKNVFIGTRCLILKGVSIGDNAVIGAGSVVTSDIPMGTLAAGNPCKIIRLI